MCGFDTFMYCNMIITIALANTYHVPELSFLWWKPLRSSPLAILKYVIQFGWLLENRVIADVIKVLEMRPFCISSGP